MAGCGFYCCSDNRNTFEQKMERLISLISRAVGLPSLARKAYKYLVKKVIWMERKRRTDCMCCLYPHCVLYVQPLMEQLPNCQVFDVEKVRNETVMTAVFSLLRL